MERPIKLIIFDLLPNDFDLSFLIKSIFAICSLFTVILGLLVHRRILSFLKKNDGRHVDQIIAFQTIFNCFLIPISLGWFVALHWLYEMKQYISPQGCYIVTILGKLFLSFSFLFLLTCSGKFLHLLLVFYFKFRLFDFSLLQFQLHPVPLFLHCIVSIHLLFSFWKGWKSRISSNKGKCLEIFCFI